MSAQFTPIPNQTIGWENLGHHVRVDFLNYESITGTLVYIHQRYDLDPDEGFTGDKIKILELTINVGGFENKYRIRPDDKVLVLAPADES